MTHSFLGPRNFFLPYLTLTSTFVPKLTFYWISRPRTIKCPTKRQFCPCGSHHPSPSSPPHRSLPLQPRRSFPPRRPRLPTTPRWFAPTGDARASAAGAWTRMGLAHGGDSPGRTRRARRHGRASPEATGAVPVQCHRPPPGAHPQRRRGWPLPA